MKITRFEDIPAWWQARLLARLIYRMTESWPFPQAMGLRQRLREVAEAPMQQIAYGFLASTQAEFLSALQSARCRVSQLQSALYLALDLGDFDVDQFQECYQQAVIVLEHIQASIADPPERCAHPPDQARQVYYGLPASLHAQPD